jgi:hypothetical protein
MLSADELDNFRRGNATKDRRYHAAMREVRKRGRCHATTNDVTPHVCERVQKHTGEHEQRIGPVLHLWTYDNRDA